MAREFETRREVDLAASPEQVWRAIATREGLTAWMAPTDVDPDSDQVVAWEPDRRLAVETPPDPGDGSTQAFEYVIELRGGGGVRLRFVHRGVAGDDWPAGFETMVPAGWDMYLFTLAQYLAWFPGLPAAYAEAEAPPSAAGADAWRRLAPALGLDGPPALGAAVRLDLPPADPIVASVDYVAPYFLGLRADDALVRFHGRWPLGMTVAVSHHAYGPGFDPARAEDGWTAWLARTF